jgi:hypothetical protein
MINDRGDGDRISISRRYMRDHLAGRAGGAAAATSR